VSNEYIACIQASVESVLRDYFSNQQLGTVWRLCAEADLGLEPHNLLALLEEDTTWAEYHWELRKLVKRLNHGYRRQERLAVANRPGASTDNG
jgi:hypothetical protein